VILEELEEVWFGYDISTDKGYDQLIKKLETMCRMSPEYKVWAKDIKMKADENEEYTCPVCNIEYIYGKMETHHHPKTLYDIVDYELQRYIQANSLNANIITPLGLCNEIMKKHLEDKVAYVNLCKSCHEKFHAMHPEIRDAVHKIYKDNLTKHNTGEKNERNEENKPQSGGI